MRRRIADSTQATVLLRCKRRCCLCFGLSGNSSIQPGQIAHLNKDNTNNQLDNLAFLCLAHHDEFDSVSSQRKNFTLREVKEYRKKLESALTSEAESGQVYAQLYEGQYIRLDDDGISAQLLVSGLLDGRFHVCGAAFRGPHMHHGFVEFIASEANREIKYEIAIDAESHYWLAMKFVEDLVLVSDSENNPMFGSFVRFAGTYKRSKYQPH